MLCAILSARMATKECPLCAGRTVQRIIGMMVLSASSPSPMAEGWVAQKEAMIRRRRAYCGTQNVRMVSMLLAAVFVRQSVQKG